MKIDGRCRCGNITFAAEVDPATVVICYCTDCQTLSGSAFREFEKCLATETTRLMATNISSQDFALLIKGTCLTEKNKFLVPLVDYVVMKNNAPDSDQSAVLSAGNSVITQYYDVAVKNFIEKRSNR
jgi:hypothetical protein